MFVIYLNLLVWLFGIKFSDITISFMHAIGQNIRDIVLHELI